MLIPLTCILLAACGGAEVELEASAADISHAGESRSLLGATGGDSPSSEGIVLGRTIDELGRPHPLVLRAPGIRRSVQQGDLFAVLSGSTTFSVTGDVVVGAWRFAVDSSSTGDAAPIVVLKFAEGSVQHLARDPSMFANAAVFNEDVLGTSARLSALVATVISKAELPDGDLYEPLAEKLKDPSWTGVLAFNASVPAVPAEVLGRPTGALAGTQVAAYNIGFTVPKFGNGHRTPASVFAIIDHSWAPGDGQASGVQHMRARFANSELVSFQLSKD
jgi:hypothetical protein